MVIIFLDSMVPDDCPDPIQLLHAGEAVRRDPTGSANGISVAGTPFLILALVFEARRLNFSNSLLALVAIPLETFHGSRFRDTNN